MTLVTTQVYDFAVFLWQPGDLIELRPLPPKRGEINPWLKYRQWVTARSLLEVMDEMERINQEGANIFAGVLPRAGIGGGTDADCLPGQVIWADFDHTDPRKAWTTVADCELPSPGLVLNSGHGAHIYWRLEKKADPAILAKIVKAVATVCKTDPSVANASRIMRVPGFINHKEPKNECKVLYCNAARTSTLADFDDVLLRCTPKITAPSAPQSQSDLYQRALAYVARIPGEPDGYRNNTGYKIAATLVNDFMLSDAEAFSILQTWNMRCAPPREEKTIQDAIDNARKYATLPPGSKIADRPMSSPATRPQEKQPSTGIKAHSPPPGFQLFTTKSKKDLDDQLDDEEKGLIVAPPLPWPYLSDMTRALLPGTITLVAGPAGYGKSLFLMQMAIILNEANVSWKFLPLEDEKVDFMKRTLALLTGEWSMLEVTPANAHYRKQRKEENARDIQSILPNVYENPRAGYKNEDGRTIIPKLPWQEVINQAEIALKDSRVFFIDPLVQIDFGSKDWVAEQSDFIRYLAAIAKDTGGNVVLNAHTKNRAGKNVETPLSMEDIQGSADLIRIAHTIIMIDRHPRKESEIDIHGLTFPKEHTRTITVAKARNGFGGGTRIAFNLDTPMFEEVGVIATGEKK